MAGGTIKGITVQIGGNTGPLNKALGDVDKTSRGLQNELRQVEKLLKLDPTNTELLAQKQKLLADSVDNTKSKLNALKEAEKQVQEQVKQGKISEEQYRAFQREVASTEIKMNSLESQGKETNQALADEKPAENFKRIGAAAGVAAAAVGAALMGMAGAALNNADELQRLSDVTGLTAERLQELKYAGNNLGVELETITGAQAKLTKSMAAASTETRTVTETVKVYSKEAIKAVETAAKKQEGALKKSNDTVYNSTKELYDKQVSNLKKSLDKEYDAYEKTADKKLKLIDKEYLEKMKLIDEDKYNQLKSIDNQIKSLEAVSEAEAEVEKKAEEDSKRAELQKRITSAETDEERQTAINDLAEFERKIVLENKKEERQKQIDSLKDQKTNINDEFQEKKNKLTEEYQLKKENLKEQTDKEKESIKEINAEKLNAMKQSKETALANLKETQNAELQSIRSINQEKVSEMKSATASVEKQVTTVSKTAEAFKKLGIETRNSDGSLRDSKVVMMETLDALGKVKNETERDALSMTIFGKSAMEMNPIIKAGSDGLKELSEEAHKNGAVMSNEAVAGLDSFGDTLDNIKTSIMGAFGEALGQLIPKIQELIAKIDMEKIKLGVAALAEKLVSLLGFIINNGSTIISLITGIAAGFIAWNVASMVMSVVEAIKAFKLANEGATIAQWALNAAQNANPIGIIVMLIAGLVTAIITLWHTNEGFRDAIIGIWEKIKSAVSTAVEKVKGIFNTVIEFIKNNWQALLLMIVNPFSGAFKLLYDNCDGFKNFVDGFINDVVGFFKELPGKVWNAIIGIKDKFNNLKTELVNWANNNLPSFIAKFVGFMLELPNKMANIGKNIVEGLWEGITGAANWLKDKITGFTNGIVNSIKSVLDIHSPSRVLADEVGKYMAQGIGVGFEAEMGSVSSNMAKAIPVNKHDYIMGNNSSSSGNGHSGDYNQTVNIYSPTPLTPSEVARQTRNASRRLVLGV